MEPVKVDSIVGNSLDELIDTFNINYIIEVLFDGFNYLDLIREHPRSLVEHFLIVANSSLKKSELVRLLIYGYKYKNETEKSLDFAEYLRVFRAKHKLTTTKLSEMTNISQPYLSQIETGTRIPSKKIIQKLSLGISKVTGQSTHSVYGELLKLKI